MMSLLIASCLFFDKFYHILNNALFFVDVLGGKSIGMKRPGWHNENLYLISFAWPWHCHDNWFFCLMCLRSDYFVYLLRLHVGVCQKRLDPRPKPVMPNWMSVWKSQISMPYIMISFQNNGDCKPGSSNLGLDGKPFLIYEDTGPSTQGPPAPTATRVPALTSNVFPMEQSEPKVTLTSAVTSGRSSLGATSHSIEMEESGGQSVKHF